MLKYSIVLKQSFVKSDRSKVTKHQVMQSFRGSSFAPLVDLCNMIFKSKMQPELHQSPSEPSLHLTFLTFFTSPTYASRNSKTLKNIIIWKMRIYRLVTANRLKRDDDHWGKIDRIPTSREQHWSHLSSSLLTSRCPTVVMDRWEIKLFQCIF